MTSFYMNYIAADALRKILDRIGAKCDSIDVPIRNGKLFAYLDDWHVDSTYRWKNEEELATMRAERERIIVEFLDAVPGAYADREKNSIKLLGALNGVKFHLTVGEALCERVEVGEIEVEKIDPDYLADAPKVTVVEKQYEWRCSDDILGSMSHKGAA